MVVHIVATVTDAKPDGLVGLCGATVEGFYVRYRNSETSRLSRLCDECRAEREKLDARGPL